MKHTTTLLLILITFYSFAQRGKDGAGTTVTISVANTIVNQYTPLTQNASVGNTTLTVASSAGFSAGDLIFVIQMQGALINAGRDTIFPDVNSSVPTNTTHGAITNYNNSGNNEFAQVKSIPNATSIELDCGLSNNYLFLGKVQVVKVPRYNSLLISGAGSITCPPWNGATGGVAIVEVENNAILNSTPSFSVTGRGFRGGAIITQTLSFIGGDKYGSLLVQEGAYKGESIAGDTTRYKVYSGLFGRGAMANGGGGGCAHNAGGGGGANGGNIASYNGRGNPVAGYNTIWNRESTNFALNTSSGGGRGGYTFSNANQSLTSISPANTSWGGDFRRAVGGYGGRPLDYSSGRLFIGGGGGAGHGNDARAGAGGNGGGMVYILCYGNLSGSGTIVADGANGATTLPGCSVNDGAGGAGGGGTIILNVAGTTNLTATTPLFARGGNGGNVNFNCGIVSNATGYGPGAGGGGGYIATSGATVLNNISGGANGIQTGNNSNISNSFPPNGATAGGAGSTGSVANYTITTSPNLTLCVNQPYTLTATTNLPGASINWYNSLVGGNPIATGTVLSSSGFTTSGTYTFFAGSCPGTFRQPIIITVNSGLVISVNSPSICPGQTATLVATPASAINYTWSTGAQTNSISVSPSATTIYTINGSNATCSGSQTVSVSVSSQPTLTVNNATICSGNSYTIIPSGATTYTWLPGSVVSTSLIVNPSTTSIYSVTGSTGGCTSSNTVEIAVNTTPTLSVNSLTICAGETATLTVSGSATSYTWQPGSFVGNSYTITPISTTTLSVLGGIQSCTAQTTATVSTGSNISLSVNNYTICEGETISIAASGANTYTWNTGQSGNSISVSPTVTTTYSVNGTIGSCSGSNTLTVFVNSLPTLTVNSSVICSGETTTLTASGANTYTWSNGNQTNTQVLSPNNTTTLSVIGTGINGCESLPVLTTITVNQTPTLTVNSPSICIGETTVLNVNGATSYTWSTTQSTSSISVSPSSSTIYTVIGANANCFSITESTVTVNTLPNLTVNASQTSGCATLCVNFNEIGNTPGNNTTYNFGDGISNAGNNLTHCYQNAGNYTVTINVVSSITGCSSIYTIPTPISVLASPVADFQINQGLNINIGEDITTSNLSSNANSYSWLACNSFTAAAAEISVPTNDTGICCIRLIAFNNTCSDTITKCITVFSNAAVVIPNVFTPNNDGKNDVFKVSGSGIKTFECIIYDRWGLKVVELNSIKNVWDGKQTNGAEASDGTYFYIINYTDVKGTSKTEKGFLSLFRD